MLHCLIAYQTCLLSNAHGKDSICRTSCFWYLVLVLGLGCNLCSLIWSAWLEQVFGCSVWVRLQWFTLGPWPAERQHAPIPAFKMQVFKKDGFWKVEKPQARVTQQSQDFSSYGKFSAEVGLCFHYRNIRGFFASVHSSLTTQTTLDSLAVRQCYRHL